MLDTRTRLPCPIDRVICVMADRHINTALLDREAVAIISHDAALRLAIAASETRAALAREAAP